MDLNLIELYSDCKAPPPLKDWARFWEKVDIRSPKECWEWKTYRVRGYGQFKLGRTSKPASRVVAGWIYGELPKDWHSDHLLCDNPPCNNPLHLYPCPQEINILRSQCPGAINARKDACGKCGKEYDIITERRRRCSDCHKKYHRERQREIRKTNKNYRAANRKYYANNKEKWKR